MRLAVVMRFPFVQHHIKPRFGRVADQYRGFRTARVCNPFDVIRQLDRNRIGIEIGHPSGTGVTTLSLTFQGISLSGYTNSRKTFRRLGNNLSRTIALTEKNETVNGAGDKPNQHDIVTGSQADGTAFTDAADHTCKNYTRSAEDDSAQVGHFDRTGGGNTSWNSAHASKGCGQENLVKTGGAGLFYCFAIN